MSGHQSPITNHQSPVRRAVEALRAAGLGPGTRLLVTTAVLAGDQADDHALRDAALAVGRTRGGSRGLVVVRQEEIVMVAPVPQGGAGAAVAGSWCRAAQGTTVTGHRPARTRRTASEPISRSPSACTSTLPRAVASTGPASTGRSHASAVNWHSSAF